MVFREENVAISERRDPILARHEFHGERRSVQPVLRQVERGLADVGPAARRRVLWLLSEIADFWVSKDWAGDCAPMAVDIDILFGRVRVEVYSHAPVPGLFWRQMGAQTLTGFVENWGMERRHHSGLWFEVLSRSDPLPVR
jgi:hypothetical protein